MSPFTQLGQALGSTGGGIDRNFSPILNYIDEFDRHFSHRHRFMNCFIPRFDLEEDANNYFLYGEVPGARVEDITIEAHDDHTLVVYGTTHRPGHAIPSASRDENVSESSDPFVKVKVEDAAVPKSEDGNTYINVDASNAGHPAPGSQTAPVSHQQYATHDYSDPNPQAPRPSNLINVDASNAGRPYSLERDQEHHVHNSGHGEKRVLLSERLVGDFHRTFAFPAPIEEEGTRASVENGVLYLVVPKVCLISLTPIFHHFQNDLRNLILTLQYQKGGAAAQRKRRIPIQSGR